MSNFFDQNLVINFNYQLKQDLPVSSFDDTMVLSLDKFNMINLSRHFNFTAEINFWKQNSWWKTYLNKQNVKLLPQNILHQFFFWMTLWMKTIFGNRPIKSKRYETRLELVHDCLPYVLEFKIIYLLHKTYLNYMKYSSSTFIIIIKTYN